MGGRVYVLGGEGADGQTLRSVLRIDPARRTVTRMPPLPDTVADAAAVATGPRDGLLIGGRRGPTGNDVVLGTVLRLRLGR
jgi:hypothetical protein